MDLHDVLIYSLKFSVQDMLAQLDKSGVYPAPPAISAFLVGAARMLAILEPDQASNYDGGDLSI